MKEEKVNKFLDLWRVKMPFTGIKLISMNRFDMFSK